MNVGHKHATKWSFGDVVWHKATKDKGIIVAIHLRPNNSPNYGVIYEDSREEDSNMEFELTDEMPSLTELPK